MKALFLLIVLKHFIQGSTCFNIISVPSSLPTVPVYVASFAYNNAFRFQYGEKLHKRQPRRPLYYIEFKKTSTTTSIGAVHKQQQQHQSKRKRSNTKNGEFAESNHAQHNDEDEDKDENNISFSNILQRNNFGKRLLTINQSNLPVVADVHANGKWQICIIKGFKIPSSVKSTSDDNFKKSNIIPPLLQVVLVEEGVNYYDDSIFDSLCCVVDIGQITHVWDEKLFQYSNVPDFAMHLSKLLSAIHEPMQNLPVNRVENTIQTIYHECTKGKRSVSLTKKDISKISAQVKENEMARHLEQLLKRGLKADMHGNKNNRLIDSDAISRILFNESPTSKSTINKLIGSKLISRDAELGGRFKRSGCIFVSADYQQNISIDKVCLLNGGWTAVDTSVKAGIEARKFAARRADEGELNRFTSADERILQRLEHFAMGGSTVKDDDSKQIDLDIREALSAMNLPHTPEGAQKALIQSGRWSVVKTRTSSADRAFEPWSDDILNLSRLLVKFEEKRKTNMLKKIKQTKSGSIDGRTNLTALPSICIDAKRASFRDDAIGLRPRSSTGRKVINAASKWEILVHIADVSDIYIPNAKGANNSKNFDYTLLRKAAESRAVSRYDLPFGPLHLMPPVALDTLALVTKTINNDNMKLPPVNRCVTLWAYIDERNGNVLDAGIERSIISAPVALTFESASAILDGNIEEIDSNSLKQIKAILTISERILSKWKENRLSTDKAAYEREQRLQMKEMIAKEVVAPRSMRDDGTNGSFQRTRGHRLVDQSLDLYGNTVTKLLSRARAAIPRASGSSAERDSRVATAPLRRYVDGIAQRQALSVLCNFGGPPMTRQECDKVKEQVNEATKTFRSSNTIANSSFERRKSLQQLETHLSSLGETTKRVVPALSTGKANEVVISGLGLSVKCGGVQGTFKPGERILVEIVKFDAENGLLNVRHYRDNK